MVLVAAISAFLAGFGKYINNDIIVSLSIAAFSAFTVEAVFKFLGFDGFMISIIRQIIYERKFLELLHGEELRRIM
jgi:hypothetical protein